MQTSKRLMIFVAAALLLVAAGTTTRLAAQDHGTTGGDAHRAVEAGADRSAEAGRQVTEQAHGDAGAAHDEHAKPALLPDPSARETWMQALWVVIIFVVLLAVLYPTAWKNVLAGLKAREDRIRRDIADAEAARARAEATLAEYNAKLAAAENSVREMLAKATADGEQAATKIRMRAQTEAEEAKDRAMRDIETARQQAVTDIYAQAADLSTTIASKILRRNLNPDDQRDLVNRSLEQLQTSVGKA